MQRTSTFLRKAHILTGNGISVFALLTTARVTDAAYSSDL